MRTCRCPCAQLAAKSGKVDVLSRRATRRATRSRHGTRRLEAGICPRLLRCVPESHILVSPQFKSIMPIARQIVLAGLEPVARFFLFIPNVLFSGSGETSVLCLNLFLSGNGRFFRSQVKAVQAARGDRERINHTSGSASAGGSNCGSTAGLSVGPTLLPRAPLVVACWCLNIHAHPAPMLLEAFSGAGLGSCCGILQGWSV